jgi:hypothetical protein
MTSVSPSIATWPKNWSPADGGRFWLSGTFWYRPWVEGWIERARAEGAGVERARDELPERREVVEGRVVRVVEVGGGVVEVGGEPDHVGDGASLDERQQAGHLQLPTEGSVRRCRWPRPRRHRARRRPPGQWACRRRSPSTSLASSEGCAGASGAVARRAGRWTRWPWPDRSPSSGLGRSACRGRTTPRTDRTPPCGRCGRCRRLPDGWR